DVTAAIATLDPDNGRLDLGAMISALNGMIEASNANFVLHVVGDFQQTSQAVRFADMIPDVINGRPVTLDVQQVAPTASSNWTIDSVIVENRSSVIASVRAFSIAEPAEKELVLSVNGVEQQRKTVNTPANGAYLVEFDSVMF